MSEGKFDQTTYNFRNRCVIVDFPLQDFTVYACIRFANWENVIF